MGCSTGFRPLITNMATMRHPTSCLLWLLLCTFATYGLSCSTQEIYVPSYVYPCAGTAGCAWDVFKANATLVIINPDSGPINSTNPDYPNFVTLVNNIKTGTSAVKIVVGYVLTHYGKRNSTLVLADIDEYYSLFNVDGIFLDEGNTSCDSSNLNLYKSYDTYVKEKGGKGYTVLNWGTNGMECFLTNTQIDNYVTFEDYFSNYSTAAPAAWVNNYNSSKFWNILHTAPDDAASVITAVATAKSRNVGQVYITNAILPNPYNLTPSSTVWTAEVSEATSCT